ncbi:hypothetical protein FEP58_04511 [Burkholderia multivorans]|nr:hypothetical protein [Burkholderia multivorans]
MRVDAYMPELPADSTAVRITAFITPAANARPA